MKTRIVRAVDSGNIQRSPAFQAIFSYFFSYPDNLPFPIVFDGAGIDVDRILANRTPATKKLDIIAAGQSYDLIRGDDARLARELQGRWSGKSEGQIPDKEKLRITRLYAEVKTDVHTLQMRFRNEALLEAGIPERYLPGMRVPFRHDENLRLVLPVEASVARKVDDYYSSIDHEMPMIRMYGDIVGSHHLKDELTGGMETAKKQVKYFMDTRDRALRAILALLPGEARS